MPDAITVSEFVAAAKARIEAGAASAWVEGEVANFTAAASGHWYFSLRDGKAQMDCVMLSWQNRAAERRPADGDSVLVFGSDSLYPPRARFQMAVRLLRFGGAGNLYRLFLQRKEKWQARGWFANRREPPRLPQTVGVVCSTAGAALHDVLQTLKARCPLARVVVYPAPAQGEAAAEKIAAMIRTASRRRECEVLLLVRGGGGLEDLWAYNEEAVVRAVHECALPVISGIGHDTDETLADYAADRRCSTPTAAAAAAAPAIAPLLQQMEAQRARLARFLQAAVENAAQRLDWGAQVLAAPQRLLAEKRQRLAGQCAALQSALAALQTQQRQQLALAAARLPRLDLQPRRAALDAAQRRWRLAVRGDGQQRTAQLARRESALALLSPEKQLQRGYSIVVNAAGKVVSRTAQAPPREKVSIRLADGSVRAVIAENKASAK